MIGGPGKVRWMNDRMRLASARHRANGRSATRGGGPRRTESPLSRDDAHPSDRVLIDGAVFDGPYEGKLKRMTAAEWLARHGRDVRAGVAIRRARDGEEGACFRAVDGVVWPLRVVGPDGG